MFFLQNHSLWRFRVRTDRQTDMTSSLPSLFIPISCSVSCLTKHSCVFWCSLCCGYIQKVQVYYTYLISVMATRSADCCPVYGTSQVVVVNYRIYLGFVLYCRIYFRIVLYTENVFIHSFHWNFSCCNLLFITVGLIYDPEIRDVVWQVYIFVLEHRI